MKFKKGDIIKYPIFSEDKKFFAEVIADRLCKLLPQDKINKSLEQKRFIYKEDISELGYDEYRELYPEQLI